MNADQPIREIMTPKANLITVYPDAKANEIKRIFESNGFHHIPVVDKGEQLVGIISKEDFFKVAYVLSHHTTGRTYSEKEYNSLLAKDFMTKYPLTVDPEDTIGLAADIFLANKFHALPIVEDERLVGLVTAHDLLAFSFNSRFIKEGEEAPEEELS